MPVPDATQQRRSFLLNLASFYTSDALQFVVYLFLTPYLLHYLGKEQYGLLAVADAVLGYLGLLNIGLTPVLTRFVAGSEAAGDRDRTISLLSTTLALFIGLGTAGMLIAWGVAWKIDALFQLQPALVPACALFLAFKGVEFAVATPLQIYAAGNYGIQNIAMMNGIRGLTGLLDAIGGFAIVRLDLGLKSLAILALFNAIVAGLLNRQSLRRALGHFRLSLAHATRPIAKELLGYSAFFALDSVIVLIVFKTDEIVIASAIGTGAVATYAIIGQASRAVMNGASRISSTLYPSYAALAQKQDFAELQRIFRRAMDGTLYVSAGFAVLFMAFVGQLVEIWLSLPPGDVPRGIVWGLGGIILTAAPVSVASKYIAGVGLIRSVAVISILEGASNLALSLLLVGRIGLTGVALGTLVSQALTTTWYNPGVALRHQGVSRARFWAGRLVRVTCVTLPSALLAATLLRLWPAPSLGQLAAQLVACAGVHVACAALAWRFWPDSAVVEAQS
jgi:O-antigen/teichoic acid export membrane protein